MGSHSQSPPTKLSVPATIASLGLQQDPEVIAGYLDVMHYGAKGDGITDDTAAFQNAINDAGGDASGRGGTTMVVYVPSGTYLISQEITGVQTYNVKNPKFGSISHYGGMLAPSLVGNPIHRPTIVLKDNSAGFTNPSSPKPIVRLVNTPTAGTTGCAGQWVNSIVGCYDVLFNAVVRDINITTGNNPGAIGVQFYSAQMSYMQNVSVNATGGYAGIEGAPATDAWVNVAVTGGQYGLMVDSGGGVSAVAGVTLANQSVAGIYFFNIVGDLSVTGFDIQETNPSATGILSTDRIAQGTTLSLLDGRISTASTSQPAIANIGGDSLYLGNTFLQSKSGQLIMNQGSTSIPATGGMQLIAEYAHADQHTNPSNFFDYAATNYIVIDNAKQQTDYGPLYGSGAPPSDVVLRHVPNMPWAFDANVAWVTDFAADPTGFTDSTVQIQNTINAAHNSGSDEVFLPRGQYSISGTLHLFPNTKFFGIPGLYSSLSGYGWVTHGTLQPYLQVGDAINDPVGTRAGTAVVSDIGFSMPTDAVQFPEYAKLLPNNGANYSTTDQTYLYAIDWQTGQNSVLNQIDIGFQYLNNITVPSPASRNYIQVDHGGGGRWYGLQIGGDWGPNGSSGNSVYVTGGSTPLTLYGSNPEHSNGASFYGFDNASNIRVLGLKTEGGGAPYLIEINNSNNIMLSGFTGHCPFVVATKGGSTNLNLNAVAFFCSYDGSPGTPPFFENLDNGTTYSFLDAYALFKVGSFNDNAFPTCSNGLNCSGSGGGGTPSMPAAAFSCNPLSGTAPVAVTCTDASSNGPTGWSWTFGDGSTSSAENPSHTYATAGTYTVTLTASNSAGSNTAKKASYITVSASGGGGVVTPNPVQPGKTIAVNESMNPGITASGTMVVFWYNSSTSTLLGRSGVMGVGFVSGTATPVATTFVIPTGAASGTYSVSATIYKDSTSGTVLANVPTFATFTVGTGVAAPTTAFSCTPVSGTAPVVVTCSDASSNAPTGWSWSFGDGSTSTSQNPTHSYSAAGTYTVSLTASNSGGSNTNTKSGYITVNASGNGGSATPNPVQGGNTITVSDEMNPGLTASGTMVVLWYNSSTSTLLGRSVLMGVDFVSGHGTPVSAGFAVPTGAAKGTYGVSATIYKDSTSGTVLGSVPTFATFVVN